MKNEDGTIITIQLCSDHYDMHVARGEAQHTESSGYETLEDIAFAMAWCIEHVNTLTAGKAALLVDGTPDAQPVELHAPARGRARQSEKRG